MTRFDGQCVHPQHEAILTEGDAQMGIRCVRCLSVTAWVSCRQCGKTLHLSPESRRRYCSNICKCKAYRVRRRNKKENQQ